MVDYRRMGNMVQHLGNTTSTISMHNFKNLWSSPRGTVLRIQALAVVAIIITFFLIAFGSCRRWSNRWIVQKGFFAAQVLSLSLGTYSIGIMQSSSVKSKMYPIWTVALFTLFGSIDPVTSYNGLDYKGPLSKVVYGICLHCGYVLIMSVSTISGFAGNMAIGMLSAITFIKGFHRSLALMQQRRMRNNVQTLLDVQGHAYVLENNHKKRKIERDCMIVSFGTGIDGKTGRVPLSFIEDALNETVHEADKRQSCYELCLAMSLSHNLQRHFLGLGYRKPDPGSLKKIKYKWALKVIEIELALVYDVFFTGNPFLHYYQAKTASLWALASFIGICYVGVAAAIPGTMSSRHTSSGDCTNFVDTTTADLVITFVILVSLALLQLMHLIRCWTSNWARVAVACAYGMERQMEKIKHGQYKTSYWRACWMRLKAIVAYSSNWFDKYLWQDKIGQYSVLPEGRLVWGKKGEVQDHTSTCGRIECKTQFARLTSFVGQLYQRSHRLVKVIGLDYIGEVLWDLLGSDTNKRTAIRLDDEVKGYIIDFLHQIKTDIVDEDGTWLSFDEKHPINRISLPFGDGESELDMEKNSHGYRYSECVMQWHIATWYCELEEQEKEKQPISCGETGPSYLKKAAAAISGCFQKEAAREGGERKKNRNRHVANALSKYCAYLVVSAPELLPGPAPAAKRAYEELAKEARLVLNKDRETYIGALSDPGTPIDPVACMERVQDHLRMAIELLGTIGAEREEGKHEDSTIPAASASGEHEDSTIPAASASFTSPETKKIKDAFRLAKLLGKDPWETLALVWVRILVCAAPYGNVEAHMRHLQHGGEFITHIWALLHHLDIRKWKLPEEKQHSTSTSTTNLPKDPQHIITIDDAERILDVDDQAVIAFLDSLSGSYNDEFTRASKLEDGLNFYWTVIPDVAKLFHIDPSVAKPPSLVLLKKGQFTLYEGEFRAYPIADFLSVNKKPQRQRRGQTHNGGIEEENPQQQS